MKNELKPCPFCGKSAEHLIDHERIVGVKCSDNHCGAFLRMKPMESVVYPTIRKWNTRSSQSIPDEQIMELEDVDLEEAIKVIRDYSDSGKYIAENIKQFMTGGEPDDNSIQLDEHYFNCLKIVISALQHKKERE